MMNAHVRELTEWNISVDGGVSRNRGIDMCGGGGGKRQCERGR